MRSQRGNYHMIMGLFLTMGLGFAAMAVDVSWIHLARSEAQDVADAASHAALLELRRSNSPLSAYSAAIEVVSKNKVGDAPAQLESLEFGTWDEDLKVFSQTLDSPHAVRATVARAGGNALPLFFARIYGHDFADVRSQATAATRSLHIVLVMDITGSFAEEIHLARQAAEGFLERLQAHHSRYDKVGMSIYYYRWGLEYTPLTYLDLTVDGDTAADWALLDSASKAAYNNFSTGGMHPAMPREYSDEPGTDHHTGIAMATQMFAENHDPYAFKAMIVLTDGRPNGLNGSSIRAGQGYVEDRWRFYEGPVPHDADAIRAATLSATQHAWDSYGINVWSVSYDAQDAFLEDMVKGAGRFYYTADAGRLSEIFTEIHDSMPMVLVD